MFLTVPWGSNIRFILDVFDVSSMDLRSWNCRIKLVNVFSGNLNGCNDAVQYRRVSCKPLDHIRASVVHLIAISIRWTVNRMDVGDDSVGSRNTERSAATADTHLVIHFHRPLHTQARSLSHCDLTFAPFRTPGQHECTSNGTCQR